MDEATLIQTYQELVYPLYEYVSKRCGGDRNLAEDVTQETWLRAVENWQRKGMPEVPIAWLKTVARNLLVNYFRRARTVSFENLPPSSTGAWPACVRARRKSWKPITSRD